MNFIFSFLFSPCVISVSGQPLPYLEWYIGDVPITSSESRYNHAKEETYTQLKLSLERKYDKSQIKCVANLKDFFPVLVTEITIQLNCEYRYHKIT